MSAQVPKKFRGGKKLTGGPVKKDCQLAIGPKIHSIALGSLDARNLAQNVALIRMEGMLIVPIGIVKPESTTKECYEKQPKEGLAYKVGV